MCAPPPKKSHSLVCMEIEKEMRFVVIRGEGEGEGKLDEGSQNVQTSSNKINMY